MLPREVIEAIDRRTRNRSRFILDAVRRELERQHREALRFSLRNPHAESGEFAEMGIGDWSDWLADALVLVKPGRGRNVSWREQKGWVNED